MEKVRLLKEEKMGEYEKEQGLASYKTIVDYFIGDIVLCNNIEYIDNSIYYNMEGIEDLEDLEIYQYYLCNLTDFYRERALKSGLILSYSDMLECDVLCVDNYGTSWDYVLTNAILYDSYEELEKAEKEEKENER